MKLIKLLFTFLFCVGIYCSPLLLAQTQLGSDIDGEALRDLSGSSVSLSATGTIMAIGAHGNNGYTGHVRVYEYSSGSWTQLGTDIDGNAGGDWFGYSVSLSADGTRVAIGAIVPDDEEEDESFVPSAGYVQIYEYSLGSWSQLGTDIAGEALGDQSGYSVSLSANGTRVAIGANRNSSYTGHVRIYEYSASNWSQLGADIDGEASTDGSGGSVSLSANGTRVAIGAHGNDGNGGNAGHVRVYEYSASSWSQLGSDIDGEAAADFSGGSVSLSANGTRVAIGAHGNDGNGGNAGHVRVYEYSASSWSQLGSDIDGEAATDYSGRSVSLSADGTRVAIGASANNGHTGHVRIYEYSASSWSQLGADIDGETLGDLSGGRLPCRLMALEWL